MTNTKGIIFGGALICGLVIYITVIFVGTSEDNDYKLYYNKDKLNHFQHLKTIKQYKEHGVKVDKTSSLSEDESIAEMQKSLSNFPIEFWYRNKNKSMKMNKTCALFPSLLDIEYNNNYWQTLRTSQDVTFHLYGAYFDNREKNLLGPTVRILSMINLKNTTVKTHCQFWFENKNEPVIVPSTEYRFVWFLDWGVQKQGTFEPHLIACVLPENVKNIVPKSVSLVEKYCDTAKNNMKVYNNKPEEKKDFAVCVKGMDFLKSDLSVKLAEWIELLHLLGADKTFFYILNVHPNITKILNYYEQQGKIEVNPISLAGVSPNAPLLQHYYLKNKVFHKRQQELIPYNDCFYRHMYEYKYIILLDTDEVIMPIKAMNWSSLIEKVLPEARIKFNNDPSTLTVQNTFFLDYFLDSHGYFTEIPTYMHMMQHVYRSRKHTRPGSYAKAFFSTEHVLSLHNHHPIECLDGCRNYDIRVEDAQLNHYRSSCDSATKKECDELLKDIVLDSSIWRYSETLNSNVYNTLNELGFFENTTIVKKSTNLF